MTDEEGKKERPSRYRALKARIAKAQNSDGRPIAKEKTAGEKFYGSPRSRMFSPGMWWNGSSLN